MLKCSVRARLERESRELLESIWSQISSIPVAELENTPPFAPEAIRKNIKSILQGRTKAFKYALMTQALAKGTDERINCLTIQAGAGGAGAFDARSLCKKVVVPFERQKLNNALGGSSDPYVSKPLRRPMISMDPEIVREIKYPDEWKALYEVLGTVESSMCKREVARDILREILLYLRKQICGSELRLPRTIGSEELRKILMRYLSGTSLGMGPQAVTYSLLKVFNKRTKTYEDVVSAPPTAADVKAGRVADIECKGGGGDVRVAVCVTQRLDRSKLVEELVKCKERNVANALFVAYKVEVELEAAYKKASGMGVGVAICGLVDFVLSTTVLLNGEMRKELVEDICGVLRQWGGNRAEMEFKDAVRAVLDMN